MDINQYGPGRNSAVAVQLTSVNDAGKEQLVGATGMAGETMTDVQRMQPFGLSANPPSGSIGVGICPGGRRDLVIVVCAEHADNRPTGLDSGDTKLYNATADNFVHLKGDEVIVNSPTKITLTVGGCSLEISSGGFRFTGGEITHDGKHIDKTHVHGKVSPGPDDTDVPSN